MQRSSMLSFVFAFYYLLVNVHSINNGLARTPQMGFSTWNAYACSLNETLARAAADTIVSLGLKDLGYDYLMLDDCWQAAERNSTTGEIIPDPAKFPSGMAALIDYVHSLGLKFGIYSDAGNLTCSGRPGSLGYEKLDANSYASWGVDYLKYDNCFNDGISPEIRYGTMAEALNNTGRTIFFALCDWGVDFPAQWAGKLGNSWRTTNDLEPTFLSVVTRVHMNDLSHRYAAPGGWNDPDMLQVGTGMTDSENQAHFSLWALVKAPLIMGCDLTTMSHFTATIFKNAEVIAVDQDSLGVQGTLVDATYPSDFSTLYDTSFLTIVPCNGQPEQKWVWHENGSLIEQRNFRCLTTYECGWYGDLPLVMPCGQGGCENNDNQLNWKIRPQGENVLLVSYYGGALQAFEGVGPQMDLFQLYGDPMQQFNNNSDGTISYALNPALCLSPDMFPPLEVWAGPQSDGSVVVVLFNRWINEANMTVSWDKIGFEDDVMCSVRDLWAHSDNGTTSGSFSSLVQSHSVVMVKLSPTTN